MDEQHALQRRGVWRALARLKLMVEEPWLTWWPTWTSASQLAWVRRRPMPKSRVSLTVVSVQSQRFLKYCLTFESAVVTWIAGSTPLLKILV